MERHDQKKTGGYHYGAHDEGYQRTDASTVELSGNIAEADLLVRALRVYVAVENIFHAMGVEFNPDRYSRKGLSGEKPKVYAQDLLGQIAEPNYDSEPATTADK